MSSRRGEAAAGLEPRARRSKGRNWGLIAAAVLVLAVAGFLVFKAVGPKLRQDHVRHPDGDAQGR